MEVNGLSKSHMPSQFEYETTKADELMSDAVVTPDRVGGSSSSMATTVHTAMNTGGAKPIADSISPTSSRDFTDESSAIWKGVRENVALARGRIQDIENRLAKGSKQGTGKDSDPQQQTESLEVLRGRLFAEKVGLVDALVIMGWEHYRLILQDESSSYESAEAAVRNIYEEALEVSIALFNSSPNSAFNNDRLMILFLALDYDEYCETLLQYQLTVEYMVAHPLSETNGADSAGGLGGDQSLRQKMEEMLRPSGNGTNYLSQLHELWKSGHFDRFDPAAIEDEEGYAKVHAASMCLALFRKMESLVDRQQATDLNVMERRFRYLFDEYLPKQLAQPSMNNIIATKYARVLFHEDGSPTVYWSLLADSYRKEWGESFDGCDDADDDSTDMDTDDDEDDGL